MQQNIASFADDQVTHFIINKKIGMAVKMLTEQIRYYAYLVGHWAIIHCWGLRFIAVQWNSFIIRIRQVWVLVARAKQKFQNNTATIIGFWMYQILKKDFEKILPITNYDYFKDFCKKDHEENV